ncbi:MAG: hypothetical protein MK098_00165 [Marinovum sp.]|nr:hypothetical protein [Marinovum sp.]
MNDLTSKYWPVTRELELGHKLINAQMERIWCAKDVDAISDIYGDSAVIEGIVPDTELAMHDFREIAQQTNELSDVLDWDFLDEFASGNRYFARLKLTMKLHCTDRVATFDSAVTFTLSETRVSHAYILSDALSYLEQTGCAPAGAPFICMAGGKLT